MSIIGPMKPYYGEVRMLVVYITRPVQRVLLAASIHKTSWVAKGPREPMISSLLPIEGT